MTDLSFIPLAGIPLVEPGDDLGALMTTAANAAGLSLGDGDILVIAQKIVSKAEDRFVRLRDVSPSHRALERVAVEVGAGTTGPSPGLYLCQRWRGPLERRSGG